MGYSQQHIDATRQRILAAAGRLMRERGYGGVSIAQIMAASGLTHGGFYAHFKSKEELFEAMVGEPFDFTNQLNRLLGEDPSSDINTALMASTYYLSPANIDQVGPACTLASSTQDVARAAPSVKQAFTGRFKQLSAAYEKALGKAPAKKNRAVALAALATCVGGLTIARSLSDDALESELLSACLAAVERLTNA